MYNDIDMSEENKMLNSKILSTIMCLLIFILGLTLGLLLKPEPNKQSDVALDELRLKENYNYINPLLECDANISNFEQTPKIKAQVEEYIQDRVDAGKIDDAAVYYRDLNNGPWFGIKEDTLFTPASLTKVPLMMSFLKKAELNPSLLNTKLLVPEDLLVPTQQTFNSPASKLMKGREYTVDTLIRHMIIYSDNTAYLVLKSSLAENEFHQIFEDFGIDTRQLRESKSSDVLSIREYSSFFRILYNSSYLNRKNSEKALKLLSETKFNSGLVAGIPDVTIAHKFGERFYEDSNEKQLHDCGIVYLKGSPYLICIMTRGSSFNELSTVIKNISSIVHTELKNQLAE